MPSLCICITCLIFSTTTLALLASSKRLIDDMDLFDAPRAFYNLQERYSPPLVPIQILLLVSEFLLTLSAVKSTIFHKAKQVQELENSPLTNYIISQIFMYLTKGLSILLYIIFAYMCKAEIDNIREDYQLDSDE